MIRTIPGRATHGLCESCREGLVRVHDNGDVVTMCDAGMNTQRVHRPVTRCTDYHDKQTASKWDLEKIAWELKTDTSGRIVGFSPPEKER